MVSRALRGWAAGLVPTSAGASRCHRCPLWPQFLARPCLGVMALPQHPVLPELPTGLKLGRIPLPWARH